MISIIKSGKSIKNSGGKIAETVIRSRRIIILTMIFALGMLLGALTVRENSSTVLIKLLTLFNNYREIKSEQSVLTNFLNSFFKYFLYLIITYCAGLCAVGMPFLYAIPLIRGMGLGIICGYLYVTYAANGIGYCLLMIFPGAVISLIVLMLSCNESIIMSKEIMMLITYRQNENEISYKMYCVRYLIFTVILAAASLVENFFCTIFSGFFEF